MSHMCQGFSRPVPCSRDRCPRCGRGGAVAPEAEAAAAGRDHPRLRPGERMDAVHPQHPRFRPPLARDSRTVPSVVRAGVSAWERGYSNSNVNEGGGAQPSRQAAVAFLAIVSCKPDCEAMYFRGDRAGARSSSARRDGVAPPCLRDFNSITPSIIIHHSARKPPGHHIS